MAIEIDKAIEEARMKRRKKGVEKAKTTKLAIEITLPIAIGGSD